MNCDLLGQGQPTLSLQVSKNKDLWNFILKYTVKNTVMRVKLPSIQFQKW
jgi:hypothetical protein